MLNDIELKSQPDGCIATLLILVAIGLGIGTYFASCDELEIIFTYYFGSYSDSLPPRFDKLIFGFVLFLCFIGTLAGVLSFNSFVYDGERLIVKSFLGGHQKTIKTIDIIRHEESSSKDGQGVETKQFTVYTKKNSYTISANSVNKQEYEWLKTDLIKDMRADNSPQLPEPPPQKRDVILGILILSIIGVVPTLLGIYWMFLVINAQINASTTVDPSSLVAISGNLGEIEVWGNDKIFFTISQYRDFKFITIDLSEHLTDATLPFHVKDSVQFTIEKEHLAYMNEVADERRMSRTTENYGAINVFDLSGRNNHHIHLISLEKYNDEKDDGFWIRTIFLGALCLGVIILGVWIIVWIIKDSLSPEDQPTTEAPK